MSTTTLPRRIVLSRKGCDETYGRCPSLVFGTEMVSVPIPEEHFEGVRKYSDLCLPASLCSSRRTTFADLIEAIPSARRGALRSDGYVHLDPDVRKDLRGQSDSLSASTWQARLGQCCNADADLTSINSGDLFLFFGWYVEAVWNENIYFQKNKSFHAIWGWLQVGPPPVRGRTLQSMSYSGEDHPHFAPLRDGEAHQGGRNSVYIGSESATFLKSTGGAGCFKYSPVLRLTHPACRKGCRSLWRLPRFFHGRLAPLPGHAWHEEGRFTCVQAAGQHQEYVFERPADGSLDAEVGAWLHAVFESVKSEAAGTAVAAAHQ